MACNPCEYCGFDVPNSQDRCPHCGRPSRFPNVLAVKNPAETAALSQRHQQALNRVDPSALPLLQQFEAAVAQASQAVIARYASEVFTLAAHDKMLYANFYQLVQAGARLPSEGFWDAVRAVVDEKLFPYYKDRICFAALSLDGRGLNRYGDCVFTLKEDMIAHRTTVFEENSIVFIHRSQLPITAELPPGYRALWQDRGRLAVAKLADALRPGMTQADFPELLLRDGAQAEDDEFIEAHIYGSISIRSVAAVSHNSKSSAIRHKALQEKLDKLGIPLKKH
jgi:hypothetical protein